MVDPGALAAQDSARAAWAAVWTDLSLGLLSVLVNGALAWLAFDGPRRQRKADKQLADIAHSMEAGKVVNLQLGGLAVCKGIFDVVNECSLTAKAKLDPISHERLLKRRADLRMNIRLLDYFLSKDIHDAAVVHALMKTKDAAENVIDALNLPSFDIAPSPEAYAGIQIVADHAMEQCAHERTRIDERIAVASDFISKLAAL